MRDTSEGLVGNPTFLIRNPKLLNKMKIYWGRTGCIE